MQWLHRAAIAALAFSLGIIGVVAAQETNLFYIGSPDRDVYFRAGQPFFKLSTAGVLSAINGGSIDTALVGSGGGTWTAMPLSAYSANAAGTWTVEAPDNSTYYYRDGSLMVVQLSVTNTSVGGTPDNGLLVTLPDVTTAQAFGLFAYVDNNGPRTIGTAYITNNNQLYLTKTTFAAWTASNNQTELRGTVMVRVIS